MKNKKLYYFLTLLIFSGGIYLIFNKIYSSLKDKLNDINTDITLLYELHSIESHHQTDTCYTKILCLGNSITKHPVKKDVEWYSNWGMAASKEEYDYVHQLQSMLRKSHEGVTVEALNISAFEQNPNINIDSLLFEHINQVDAIVIRIGENVKQCDIEAFRKNLPRLIEYCKQKASKVMITGNFWYNPTKEQVIIESAHKEDIKYIPLFWIARSYNIYPQLGDTLYDTHGKTYTIKKTLLSHILMTKE